MHELHHFFGICPDSTTHISVLKAIVASSDTLYTTYLYITHYIARIK